MPSPFPGMDPYLEDHTLWGGVHQALITYSDEQLQHQLRARGYYADIGERVIAIDTEERQVFVEVYAPSGELVTVIEVLSPTNKVPGPGRDKYLEKQQEVLSSAVNLVEIDLLREGLLAVPEAAARMDPRVGRRHYLVCIHRSQKGPKFDLYPILLRNRLPRIAIPLKPGDADAVLDLHTVFERCYDTGPYEQRIDYRTAPSLPLDPADADWADRLLKERGLKA